MRAFAPLKTVAIAAGMLAGVAFAGPAQAVPTVALKLAMDASGSISDAQFTAQLADYNTALGNVIPGLFGQVAIGPDAFGANVVGVFPMTEMTAPNLAALQAALAACDTGGGARCPAGVGGPVNEGATAIGDAIQAAAAQLLAYQASLGKHRIMWAEAAGWRPRT